MADQVMLTRAALEKCVRTYKYEKASYFQLPAQLKPKQIANAVKRIAPGIAESDVVAVMDTTLFSSGKDGYLMTRTHMYGRSFEGKTIDLNRVCKINRNDGYLTVTYPDGKSDRLYAIIYDQDIFNLLKLIMEESAALNQAKQDYRKDAAPEPEFGKSKKSTPVPKPDPEPELPPVPALELTEEEAPPAKADEAEEEPAIVPTPAMEPDFEAIDEPDDEPDDEPAPAPAEPAPADGASADALFEQGRALFMKKDYPGAAAAFRKAADMGHQKAAQFLAQLKAIMPKE